MTAPSGSTGAVVLSALLFGAAASLVTPGGPPLASQVRAVAWQRIRRLAMVSRNGRRAPGREVPPPPVVADLVAALLAAGLPTAAALRVVVAAAREAGLAEPAGVEPLVEALALADATGLAPAGLVRAAAAEQRRRLSAARSVAAGRLSVLVVLPMGLCLLPAFVLLTVAPLAIGLLQS